MSWSRPVRVVGVGSPLGDDAVAWEVVRELQREKEWGSETEFQAVEGGQRLLDVLDGRGTLLLVDALGSRVAPGTIQRLEWPDPRIEALAIGTKLNLSGDAPDHQDFNMWDGRLDELAIFNHALTKAQIRELYELGSKAE